MAGMSTSSHPYLRPGIFAAAGFSLLYMIAAVVGAIVERNGEFVFYILVMLVLMTLIALLHRRINLTTGLFWCLAIWGALHMAGGLVPVPQSWPINGDVRVLYSWWLIPGLLKYDHVVHAFGFATTAWLCWQGLRHAAPNVRPTLGPLVLCAAASMGFGALNEIIEFIATKLGPSNVGGYDNTCWDLVSNTVGAIIAVTLIGLFTRNDSPPAE